MTVRRHAKRRASQRARDERAFGRMLRCAWHDHYMPTELKRREQRAFYPYALRDL